MTRQQVVLNSVRHKGTLVYCVLSSQWWVVASIHFLC
jgi:hypothetical protein